MTCSSCPARGRIAVCRGVEREQAGQESGPKRPELGQEFADVVVAAAQDGEERVAGQASRRPALPLVVYGRVRLCPTVSPASRSERAELLEAHLLSVMRRLTPRDQPGRSRAVWVPCSAPLSEHGHAAGQRTRHPVRHRRAPHRRCGQRRERRAASPVPVRHAGQQPMLARARSGSSSSSKRHPW